MPSINLRELRDTRRLKAWLRAGTAVELRERDRVLARIVPVNAPAGSADWPDFTARRARIFGRRQLAIVETLIEERGRF